MKPYYMRKPTLYLIYEINVDFIFLLYLNYAITGRIDWRRCVKFVLYSVLTPYTVMSISQGSFQDLLVLEEDQYEPIEPYSTI